MGINLKLYFKDSPDSIYFYDTGVINTTGVSGNIRFYWSGLGIDKTISISEFKRNGFVIENTQICQYQLSIESSVDIMIGCSNSTNVYRVEGTLPYLGGSKYEISNFDKICLPLFDTSKVLKISGTLMNNNRSCKRISYFFSDHREWRSNSDSAVGNQLLEIPDGLLSGFNGLIELNGYMTRMDNIISIPNNHLVDLINLETFRGFNDCKKLANIVGGKISNSKIKYVIMFNNLMNNCFIPSGIITSGGSGYLMCYIFNNCNSENKMVSFEEVLKVPSKRVCFMSNVNIDVSKSSKYHNGIVVEYGKAVVTKVSNDDEIVSIWKTFYDNKVAPIIRNNGDYSDVKNIYTISIV